MEHAEKESRGIEDPEYANTTYEIDETPTDITRVEEVRTRCSLRPPGPLSTARATRSVCVRARAQTTDREYCRVETTPNTNSSSEPDLGHRTRNEENVVIETVEVNGGEGDIYPKEANKCGRGIGERGRRRG